MLLFSASASCDGFLSPSVEGNMMIPASPKNKCEEKKKPISYYSLFTVLKIEHYLAIYPECNYKTILQLCKEIGTCLF